MTISPDHINGTEVDLKGGPLGGQGTGWMAPCPEQCAHRSLMKFKKAKLHFGLRDVGLWQWIQKRPWRCSEG